MEDDDYFGDDEDEDDGRAARGGGGMEQAECAGRCMGTRDSVVSTALAACRSLSKPVCTQQQQQKQQQQQQQQQPRGVGAAACLGALWQPVQTGPGLQQAL
jgi:hypothetical protein